MGQLKGGGLAVGEHVWGGCAAPPPAERHPDQAAGPGLTAWGTTADSETARQGRHDTIEKVRQSGTKVLLPGLAEKLVGPRGGAAWRHQAELLIDRARPDGVTAALAPMATPPAHAGACGHFAGA